MWEQSTRLNSVTAKRHKKVLKDAGFTLDKQGEKIEEAMGKIKRLKEHEDKHGNLNDLPNKEDERFLHAVKALYRKINAGTAKPTPYSRKVFSEVDKQFNKTFIWMPSKTEKIPNISATKQVSSAGNESISYKFNVSFDGECRQYMRKDLVLLKEMRDKVMEAGHHIDFPKPPAHNKGRDNWKKKAEAEKEANKPYWEKHGWDDKKIQILKVKLIPNSLQRSCKISNNSLRPHPQNPCPSPDCFSFKIINSPAKINYFIYFTIAIFVSIVPLIFSSLYIQCCPHTSG